MSTGTTADRGTAANETRGIFAGGFKGQSVTNEIDYITLGSPGNSTTFGDLVANMNPTGAATDGIVAAFVALSGSVIVNTVNIDTLGNASSWGSLPTGPDGNRFQFGSCTSGSAA